MPPLPSEQREPPIVLVGWPEPISDQAAEAVVESLIRQGWNTPDREQAKEDWKAKLRVRSWLKSLGLDTPPPDPDYVRRVRAGITKPVVPYNRFKPESEPNGD